MTDTYEPYAIEILKRLGCEANPENLTMVSVALRNLANAHYVQGLLDAAERLEKRAANQAEMGDRALVHTPSDHEAVFRHAAVEVVLLDTAKVFRDAAAILTPTPVKHTR